MEEFVCINGKAERCIREKYFDVANVFLLPTLGDNSFTYRGMNMLVPIAYWKGNYESAYDTTFTIEELKTIYEDFKIYVTEYENLPENIIDKEYLNLSKVALGLIPTYIHTKELAYEIDISSNKAKTCLDILLRNYFDSAYYFCRRFSIITEIFEAQRIENLDDFYNVSIKFSLFDRHSSSFRVMLLRKAYALAEQHKLDDNLGFRLTDFMMNICLNKPKSYIGALTKSDIKFIIKTKL